MQWSSRAELSGAVVKLRLMSTKQAYTNVIEDGVPNAGSYRWTLSHQLQEVQYMPCSKVGILRPSRWRLRRLAVTSAPVSLQLRDLAG